MNKLEIIINGLEQASLCPISWENKKQRIGAAIGFLLNQQQPQDNAELVECVQKWIDGSDDQTHPFLISLLEKAIAALSQPKPDLNWLNACCDAGSLLMAYDEGADIFTGHQITSISGGADYIDGFPRGLTLCVYGDENGEHVRYAHPDAVEKPFDVLAHLRGGGVIHLLDSPEIIVRLYDGKFECLDVHKEWADVEDIVSLMQDLVNSEWKPYTEPEPTPQDLLEKAREELTGVLRILNQEYELDKITEVFDEFDKLINDK